jgi:hypothetical protein
VERTLDAVADDGAAVSDVGAEVLAVGLHDMKLTLFITVGDQILAEIVQWPGLADGELR